MWYMRSVLEKSHLEAKDPSTVWNNIISTEATVKIQCPNCMASYRVDISKIPDQGVYRRCPKCQIRFVLLKVLRGEKAKASDIDLALLAPDIRNNFVGIYTKDSKKLLSHLRDFAEQREGLVHYKNSLIDTKLALEESVNALLKSKAKLRMLEEELRRIRKMSWWKRLFWRG